MKRENVYQSLAHTAFWLIIIGIAMYYRALAYDRSVTVFLVSVTDILFLIAITYGNIHFFLKRYYEQKKYAVFALWVPVSLLTVSVLRYWAEKGWALLLESGLAFSGEYVFLAKIITSIVMFASSSAYYLTYRYISVKNEQIKLERDKLRSEMDFLKARINPHFLFNTLSNIHSLAFNKSDRTADMVMQLADLMRYMLYDCQARMLPLDKEIEFIKNYIVLQQMKTPYEQKIHFHFEQKVTHLSIEPLLFVSFVENAIKYSNVQQDGWVSIRFDITEERIIFSIRNNIDPQSVKAKEERSGFGLSNVKERLQLLYPHSHRLHIEEKNGEFWVTLEITLQEKNLKLQA